jgi:hypothetical protein
MQTCPFSEMTFSGVKSSLPASRARIQSGICSGYVLIGAVHAWNAFFARENECLSRKSDAFLLLRVRISLLPFDLFFVVLVRSLFFDVM